MSGYTSKDIRVLKEIEHIQLNSGMYIGDTSTPTHLWEEALDNSLDEALAGYATIVAMIIDTKLNKFLVIDNGRGIPLGNDTPIVISSKLFSGAKFQDKKSAYGIAAGIHGVGLVAVNALSKEYTVEIYRNKQHAIYCFKDSKLKKSKIEDYKGDHPFSTKIEFIPNKKYFHSLMPDIDRIRRRLTTASAEMPDNLKFVLTVDGKTEVFNLDIENHFIKSTLGSTENIEIINLLSEKKPEKFQVLFTYESTGSVSPKIMSSVNLLPVDQGGSHVGAFWDILKEFFIAKGKKYGFTFQANDVFFRLRAYLMLSLLEPKFSGQTKDKLINHKTDFYKFKNEFKKQLEVFAVEKEGLLKDYLERFQDYRRRLDSQKLKKNGTGGRRASTQFTKLRDCTTRNGELYIVEGESAGGCCLGSTKIKLADGRNIAIIDLVKEDFEGKDNFIYAYDHNTNSIKIQKLSAPRKTKRNAALIKVNLSNGENIICTPDHKFMLRNGSYTEAHTLQNGDSLMPLYTKLITYDMIRKCGIPRLPLCYETILQPSGKYELTHWIADKWNLENKIYSDELIEFDRHHKDKNSVNNNPTNIIRLTKSEHMTIHSLDSAEIIKTKEYRDYMSLKMKEQSSEISERSKKQWEDDCYKEYMVRKWKEFYNTNEEYREKLRIQLYKMQEDYWKDPKNREKKSKEVSDFFKNNPDEVEKRRVASNEQWDNSDLREWRSQETKKQMSDPEMIKRKLDTEKQTRLHNCMLKIKELGIDNYSIFRTTQPRKYMKINTIIQKFFNGEESKFKNAIQNYNHSVISIEHLDYRDDVYDIEVPIYHNFATSAGVFIHNSILQSRDPRLHAVLPLKGKSIPNVTVKKNILDNKEVGELVRAIGAGIEPQFDLSKMRYDKIICATDADFDGFHIACLVTMVIAVLLPGIIKAGRYFIAQTPLFAINEKRIFIPLWSEKNVEKARAKGRNIQRYKGLGEMNPSQLKICLLDEETRNLMPIEYSKNMNNLVKLFSSPEEKRKLVMG